jgi:MFS family permease
MVVPVSRRVAAALQGKSLSLFLAITINAFGAGMFFPFALLYYQHATDLSVSTIGVALTAATLITLAVGPITGALVDRYGARRLVVIAQCIEAVGFVGYLMVSSAESLFVAAMVATAGTRMFFASFSTLIAESVEGADRDRWYGLVGMSQSVGASVSGLLASFFVGSVGFEGFRGIIVGNACCLLLSAALIGRSGPVRIVSGHNRDSGGYSRVLRDRVFLVVVACNGLFILCSMMFGVGFTVFAVDALDMPFWTLGAIGVLNTLFTVCMQTRITDRVKGIRRTRSMLGAGGVLIAACSLYVMGLHIPESMIVPYVLIAGLVFTSGQLLYVPASRAFAATLAPEGVQGRYVAAFEFSYGAAAASAPALFGYSFDRGPAAPWLVMIGVLLMAVTLLRLVEARISLERNVPLLPAP